MCHDKINSILLFFILFLRFWVLFWRLRGPLRWWDLFFSNRVLVKFTCVQCMLIFTCLLLILVQLTSSCSCYFSTSDLCTCPGPLLVLFNESRLLFLQKIFKVDPFATMGSRGSVAWSCSSCGYCFCLGPLSCTWLLGICVSSSTCWNRPHISSNWLMTDRFALFLILGFGYWELIQVLIVI